MPSKERSSSPHKGGLSDCRDIFNLKNRETNRFKSRESRESLGFLLLINRTREGEKESQMSEKLKLHNPRDSSDSRDPSDSAGAAPS